MRAERWCSVGVTLLMSCRAERKRTSAASDVATTATESRQGLSGPQIDSLHHLGEGDEFMEVAWLEALKSVTTKRPFLENFDRFGMRPDSADRHGLPIGLSALKPCDLGVFGKAMVGFSCAACHTGRLTHKGKQFVVEGGAALVDAEGFEQELLASMDALRTSPSEWGHSSNGYAPTRRRARVRYHAHRRSALAPA